MINSFCSYLCWLPAFSRAGPLGPESAYFFASIKNQQSKIKNRTGLRLNVPQIPSVTMFMWAVTRDESDYKKPDPELCITRFIEDVLASHSRFYSYMSFFLEGLAPIYFSPG